MDNPLVSAVIPSYNRSTRTQRAVDSVASQTYSPIELIVVDDGSVKPIGKNITLPSNTLYHTECIRYEKNQGANVARNIGIKKASGEYIAFLDSDDKWESTKISRQINALGGSSDTVSYTGIKNLDEKGDLNNVSHAKLAGDLSDKLLQKNVLGTFSSIVAPANLFDLTGPLDPDLPCYQDWEWYLRASDYATFTPVSEPLTIKYGGEDRISKNFYKKKEIAYPKLKSKIQERASTERIKRDAMSELQFQLGYAALFNEEYSFARQFFAKSALSNCWNWRTYVYLLLSGPHLIPLQRIKRTLVRTFR